MSLRETALELVIAETQNAARKDHEQMYERLHVRRDGTVSWFAAVAKDTNLVDEEAAGLTPIKSVIVVGVGDNCSCNCDYCNQIGDDYTAEDAISDYIANEDIDDYRDRMIEEFGRIEQGYFHDEQ